MVHGKYPGPGPTRSHQSGNHLTNRQSQPPPPVSSLLPPLPGWRRPSWTSETPPDVTRPRLEVAGGQNCHLIVKFDAKNSNFPSAAFYFPTWRGPGGQLVPSARLDWTATDQSWELLSPRLLLGSNRQIQTGSSAGRRDLIPRNINCLAWRERERERECLTDCIGIFQ